jgi:hypothetical protein
VGPRCLTVPGLMITVQQAMNQTKLLPMVTEIMTGYARNTGLWPVKKAPGRYLWTDAFAVCNFLELYRQRNEEIYLDLALQLVDQVHDVLGRHREDDRRKGWISGLSEREGRMRPTSGGLRIGKKLNERKPEETYDDRLEWDQDGQYFHYLTRWMHALNRVSRVTKDFTYNRWAVELARTAHERFVYAPPRGRGKQMYWKMSIDLSYPLVPSMGHHDPLDGLITYSQLQATAMSDPEKSCPDLGAEILDMTALCEGRDWITDDPLGLGGLLSDSYRVAQLVVMGRFEQAGLVWDLLDASLPGLHSYLRRNPFKLTASYRLAFRELGLSIGLGAVGRLGELLQRHREVFLGADESERRLGSLEPYLPLAEKIETFWLERTNQKSDAWMEHREINMVMLATSLAPDGYLTL